MLMEFMGEPTIGKRLLASCRVTRLKDVKRWASNFTIDRDRAVS